MKGPMTSWAYLFTNGNRKDKKKEHPRSKSRVPLKTGKTSQSKMKRLGVGPFKTQNHNLKKNEKGGPKEKWKGNCALIWKHEKEAWREPGRLSPRGGGGGGK